MKFSHFNEEHRILADDCAVNARNKHNQALNDYMIFNYFKGSTDKCDDNFNKQPIQDMMVETHMNIKDGYGITENCLIDTDSKIRNDAEWTNPKHRVPLNTRVFTGIPNINKGGLKVPIEDKVKIGEYDSTNWRVLTEKQFPVFTPLVPSVACGVQNDKVVVQPWEGGSYGGVSTRDFIQQKKFLERSGYVFDNNVWKKKYCSRN